ncbi:hypothetical protein [Sutcliffiella deserti]|uniref:hypothetical protein n=1 Tax=Sutcliffiella deserti TaxID=2875501 RepID=UPI001CBACAE4|nr:hypothetical protein [Sutcliffiella deserti]
MNQKSKARYYYHYANSNLNEFSQESTNNRPQKEVGEINIGNPIVNVHVKGCCEDSKKKDSKSKKGKLVDFAYDTEFPTNFGMPNTRLLVNIPTVIAEVSLDEVEAGNVIWLNGIFHVFNQTTTPQFCRIRMFRDSINSANLIYDSLVEIDDQAQLDDNFNQIMTSQYVDPVNADQTNRRYFLTAETTSTASNMFVNGPITFTAAEIKG